MLGIVEEIFGTFETEGVYLESQKEKIQKINFSKLSQSILISDKVKGFDDDELDFDPKLKINFGEL